MEYERLKKRKQKHNWFFDQTDFVRNIYQRLSNLDLKIFSHKTQLDRPSLLIEYNKLEIVYLT
jgi:hypothetical protein